MTANCSSGSACPANSSEEELPGMPDVRGSLGLVFTVGSVVMIAMVMFSLGCSVDIQKLWGHLRRPWGVAVGLVCQFGLMPLTAYLLAISFSLKPVQGVAVLIMGCCPGGTISNIFAFWVDGDMDLSISMTTCSTVAALGMMPLCLYLYTWSWDLAHNVTVPYQNIGISLLCLTIPVAFGIYVNYKWPKLSKIILKVGAFVGGLLLLVVTVAGVVLSKEFWNSDANFLTISFIFPLVGHISGFLLALFTRQSWQRCRTISLETGAQNIQMCITMLQLSFTAEDLVQMFNFPLAYGFFQLLDGLLIIIVYQTYKRLKSKHRLQSQDCAEAPAERTSKETSVFLHGAEASAVTPGPSGLGSPLTFCEQCELAEQTGPCLPEQPGKTVGAAAWMLPHSLANI